MNTGLFSWLSFSDEWEGGGIWDSHQVTSISNNILTLENLKYTFLILVCTQGIVSVGNLIVPNERMKGSWPFFSLLFLDSNHAPPKSSSFGAKPCSLHMAIPQADSLSNHCPLFTQERSRNNPLFWILEFSKVQKHRTRNPPISWNYRSPRSGPFQRFLSNIVSRLKENSQSPWVGKELTLPNRTQHNEFFCRGWEWGQEQGSSTKLRLDPTLLPQSVSSTTSINVEQIWSAL